MPTVTGRINVSAGFRGRVRFTPDSPFVDTTTDPDTLVIEPYQQDFTGPTFSIVVPQSQNLSGQTGVLTSGVTYKIELLRLRTSEVFYFGNGTLYTGPTVIEAGVYYTGDVYDANVSQRLSREADDVEELIQEPIHAVITETPATQEFTSLKGIPFTANHEDIGLYRLAKILTDPTLPYKDSISAKFQVQGAYSATTAYNFGDVVLFDGSSWVYQLTTSKTGAPPPASTENSNTEWAKLAQKGDAGGTGAQSIGFNATTWQNDNSAASRADVAAAIASVTTASVDLSNYYTKDETVPKNNPIFTGSVRRDTLNYATLPGSTDKTREIPTIQLVEDAIGRSSAAGLGKPILYVRKTTEQDVRNTQTQTQISGSYTDLLTKIAFDTYVVDNSSVWNRTQNRFVVPEIGDYLMFLNIRYEYKNNLVNHETRGVIYAYAFDFQGATGTPLGNFFISVVVPARQDFVFEQNCGFLYLHNLQKDAEIEVRLRGQKSGDRAGNQFSFSSGVNTRFGLEIPAANDGNGANNQLLVWRLS